MQIFIKLLDLGDADSCILRLSKNGKELVLLIDGGRAKDADQVLSEVGAILKEAKKSAPDVVVCTHYDADHIGGLKKIIQTYGKDIGEVWMHKTSRLTTLRALYKHTREDSGSILPSEDDDYIGSPHGGIVFSDDPDIQFVMEGLRQEVELAGLIERKGILCREPIEGHCRIEGWDEVKVVGPTAAYYQSLFPKHFDESAFVRDEAALRGDIETGDEPSIADPCEAFESMPKIKVTAPNLNSAIILIEADGKKFLFAGDAGIPSFYAINDYSDVLKGIFWLKMPHHGSKNNITRELLGLMSPTNVFISGRKYVCASLVKCLRAKGSIVYITSENGPLQYPIVF